MNPEIMDHDARAYDELQRRTQRDIDDLETDLAAARDRIAKLEDDVKFLCVTLLLILFATIYSVWVGQ